MRSDESRSSMAEDREAQEIVRGIKKQGPPAESALEPPAGPVEDIPASHWHVAHGLDGYGPDGSDDNWTSTQDFGELLQVVADDLQDDLDQIGQACDSDAEQGNAKELLKDYRIMRAVEQAFVEYGNAAKIRGNDFWEPRRGEFDAQWTKKVHETFPMKISHNTNLYVWECEFPDVCEHYEPEEQE